MRSRRTGEVRPAPQPTLDDGPRRFITATRRDPAILTSRGPLGPPSPPEGALTGAKGPAGPVVPVVICGARCDEPPPRETDAAGCRQSTDRHADGGNLPPTFQSHRNFRRRSSRLRKDPPYDANRSFTIELPAAPLRSRIPDSPAAPMCALSRSGALFCPLGPSRPTRRNLQVTEITQGDVGSVDSVDSNFGATCGRKLLRPNLGPSTTPWCLLPAARRRLTPRPPLPLSGIAWRSPS